MTKRIIEVFVAGCPLCDEAVKQVQSITCPSCDLRILDMRTDTAAQEKASQYGVSRVPAVVVDGKLAECCAQRPLEVGVLKALVVGRPV